MNKILKWYNESNYLELINHYQYLPKSKDNIYMLSLLLRLTDQYDKEYKLLISNKKKYSDWSYINQRLNWHQLDEFDKLVPRPLLKKKQLLKTNLIQQHDLDKLIIVTGGDSGFFTWIVETIESVRAGGLYKNVQIGVIDCGLLKEQKLYLQQNFNNITIKDPGFDFASLSMLAQSWKCGIPDKNIEAFKAITSRAYLDQHFSGYEFYFWIDADAWIQDENSIQEYISLAKKQSVGMSENNFAQLCNKTMFYNDKYMTQEMLALLENKKSATCTGVVCMTPKFLEKWRLEVEKLYKEKGIVNNSPSFWYSMHKYVESPEFLPHSYQFFFKREGLPLVNDNQELYGAKSKLPCGIIHLNGFYGVRERYRYFPTIHIDSGYSLANHIDTSWHAIQESKNNLEINPLDVKIFSNQTKFSFRYRVWPWKDKPNIRIKIKELLTQNLI